MRSGKVNPDEGDDEWKSPRITDRFTTPTCTLMITAVAAGLNVSHTDECNRVLIEFLES